MIALQMKQKQAKLKKGFNKGINKMQMSARNTIRESRNPLMQVRACACRHCPVTCSVVTWKLCPDAVSFCLQIFGGGRTQG